MGQPEEKVVKMHLAPLVRGRRAFAALTSAGKACTGPGARVGTAAWGDTGPAPRSVAMGAQPGAGDARGARGLCQHGQGGGSWCCGEVESPLL